MAHPWIFESSFENTTTSFGWDSETDTGSKLSVPPYYKLAKIPAMGMPYRGASCLWIDLRSGQTADAILTEGDMNIADAGTAYFRFYLWLSPDFAATADDVFNLFELQETGNTAEASLGLRITATTDAVEIGIGDGTAPSDYAASALSKGEWHCIEWKVKIDTSSGGTQDLYVDGSGSLVALTSLDASGAVTHGVLGTQNTLATTTGTILIDQFVMDDAQVYPLRERFPETVTLTESGHVFVGPGDIAMAALLSTTSGDTMKVYDTDTGNSNDAQGLVVDLGTTANISVEGPFHCERGCYVALSGTNPRGQIQVVRSDGGPPFYSEWGMRYYGQKRTERLGNI